MAIDLSQTAPPAPTTDEPQTTAAAFDQADAPPATEQVSDTPAWQRATSREEALAAILADETLPSEVLTQHPRLSGLIGTRAQQQARDLRKQEAEHERITRRQQAAREGRYSELGEDVAGEYVKPPEVEMRERAFNDLMTDAQRALAPMLQSLPAEARAELEGKTYDGPFGDGLKQWLDGVVEARVKAREEDLRKSIRAELSGEEPESPDVQSGSPSNGRSWRSVAEVEQAFLNNEATAQDVRHARARLPYRI